MTSGGRFIAAVGSVCVGGCLGSSAYLFAQEYFGRKELPLEMQTAEMIQKHFDGEVILFSLTFAYGLLVLGVALAGIFACVLAAHESKNRTLLT